MPEFQIPRFPAPPPSARFHGGRLRGRRKQVSISAAVPAMGREPLGHIPSKRSRFQSAPHPMPPRVTEPACSDDVGLRVRSPIASGNKVLCCAFEPPYLTLT